MAKRAPDTYVTTLVLAICAGICTAAAPGESQAQSVRAARRAAIHARLKPIRTIQDRLKIAPGDTAFLETTVRVPTARLKSGPLVYEALVTAITSPTGIVVHRRVHQVELQPRGADTYVRFVYALHVQPGAVSGGKVKLTLNLVERRGLANIVIREPIVHNVRLGKSNPSPQDLAADFYGYRYYRRLAQRRRKSLSRVGVKLSIKDQDPLPPLDRAPAKVAAQLLRYDQERRLFWVAQRHLVAAMQHPDPRTRELAQVYLRNMDLRRSDWKDVPAIDLVPVPGGARSSAPPPSSEEVTRLQPDSERPIDTSPSRDPNRPQRLKPSTEYEVGTERPPPPPTPPAISTAPPPPPAPTKRTPRRSTNEEEEAEGVIYEEDTFGDQILRRLTKIPSYYRGLVFDDPNIAHGAAIRTVYASIQTREAANTVAVFYSAQAAFTRSLGAEITVPTQYLDITSFPGDRDPPAQYVFGNPLVALKYRFHLPRIGERHPAITVKARWGIPFEPLHGVPATELIVEEFTREVHFTDTYAFFLENHDFGLGANFAWQWKWLYTGLQLFGDLFVPVGGASQTSSFTAISYGATVGALPFGDHVGFFVEGRGTSLLLGGGRNEFFTYLGARGRLLEMIEPALWIGLPVGSIREASPIQFGLEVRFSYDVVDVLEPRRDRRRQDNLLE